MPQTPLTGKVINGAMMVGEADTSSLNVTAAAVIKATPGYLCRVVVIVAGSGSVITFNDCTTTGAAAASNTIWSIASASATAGSVFYLDWPCADGIVCSSISTGATIAVSFI